jgi:hypothetical protein
LRTSWLIVGISSPLLSGYFRWQGVFCGGGSAFNPPDLTHNVLLF